MSSITMDPTSLVGYTAVVCTIASSFAGLPLCLEMVKKKSTLGKSYLPFLSAAVHTSLWFQYGILTGDGMVSTVNLVAASLQCCYLGSFYYAAVNKADLVRWLMASIFLLLSLHGYYFHACERQEAVWTIGLLSSCGSVASCAAPLSCIGKVLRTRSTESLPFLIILGSFSVSTLWYIYGVLIQDSFVQIPNFIGALLCAFQLSLFAIFDGKKKENGERDLKKE